MYYFDEITPEAFTELLEGIRGRRDTAMLKMHSDPTDSFRLSDYFQLSAEYSVFKNILDAYERADGHASFLEIIEDATRIQYHDPLSTSSSPVRNLMDEVIRSVKNDLHNSVDQYVKYQNRRNSK